MLSDIENGFMVDTKNLFESENGARVLDYLKKVLGVEQTLEPEEVYNKEMEASERPERLSIDPYAMAKRQGMRSAYFKIVALIQQGTRIMEKESNE